MFGPISSTTVYGDGDGETGGEVRRRNNLFGSFVTEPGVFHAESCEMKGSPCNVNYRLDDRRLPGTGFTLHASCNASLYQVNWYDVSMEPQRTLTWTGTQRVAHPA